MLMRITFSILASLFSLTHRNWPTSVLVKLNVNSSLSNVLSTSPSSGLRFSIWVFSEYYSWDSDESNRKLKSNDWKTMNVPLGDSFSHLVVGIGSPEVLHLTENGAFSFVCISVGSTRNLGLTRKIRLLLWSKSIQDSNPLKMPVTRSVIF